jgi:hypothetical protein
MKINFYIFVISSVFISCSNSKSTFKSGALDYLEYKSKNFNKQLKDDYLFSEDELTILDHILIKNFIEKSERKKKFVRIDLATSTIKNPVNQNNYGLFIFSSSEPYPNFFFLRTEHNIVYFKCDRRDKYESILKESSKIEDSIKINIISFIEDRCLNGDMLSWMNGRVF